MVEAWEALTKGVHNIHVCAEGKDEQTAVLEVK
jgi:hypothetical protein